MSVDSGTIAVRSSPSVGVALAATLSAILTLTPAPAAAQTQEEIYFGNWVDRFAAVNGTLLINDEVEARLTALGKRVAQHSPWPESQFTFRIVNDATINAFALSGGFVYVTTGLLDTVESEDELAGVLGHEIAHASYSHSMKSIAFAGQKSKVARLLGPAISIGIAYAAAKAAQSAGASDQFAAWSVDKGLRLGPIVAHSFAQAIVDGYSRELELEADALGVKMAISGGYDPEALIRFFRRLAAIRDRLEAKREYGSSLINAEPGLDERISIVTKMLTPATP